MSLISSEGGRTPTLPQRFDALLRPHVPLLYRVAYRYTGRREDAEDLVQDLLTKLYPRTTHLEQLDSLRPWLMRSLYNAFVDGVRRERRAVDTSPLPEEDPAGETDLTADAQRLELRSALASAMSALSSEHRAIVVLHLIEGHSLPELQDMLDVPIGTLKSRLHRAKAHLREVLRGAWDDALEPKSYFERVNGHEL
jgi:RNA polymerase sigma factor (sigma-70 family)